MLVSGSIRFVDAEGTLVKEMKPHVLICADGQKRRHFHYRCPIVVGLGRVHGRKGCLAVVETREGIISACNLFRTAARIGIPKRRYLERLLRASASRPLALQGNWRDGTGEKVADAGGTPVIASISGLIRGMLYPGLEVKKGMKVGDIDPRGKEVDWKTISDKARSVAGGVLEAVLHFLTVA